MRILIDLSSLNDNYTGIERYAKNMAEKMVMHDQDNHYILLFKNEIFSEFLHYIDDNEHVECIVVPGGNKLVYYQYNLLKALKKIKADRYIFFAFQSPWLFRAKGIFNTIHDVACFDCPDTMKTFQKMYFKYSYRRAAKLSQGIITVSEFSKKRIHDVLGVDLHKVHVVNSGLEEGFFIKGTGNTDFETVQKKLGLPDEYLLCLSTLEPRKNLKLLIEAYGDLKKESIQLPKLVLVGRKGWMIDELLATAGDDVLVTGFVDNEDLPALYSHSRLFVFPSLYEGFGLPPVEALAMGADILSSDAASLPEVLGSHATYFENCNIESLKTSIKRILDGSAGDHDKEAGKQWALNYNFDKSSQKLLTILAEK